MKQVYSAGDLSEAHIIAGMLKAHEVEAYVGGHYLQGGVGDLAAMGFATLHVADEDVDAAISIIAEYEQNSIQLEDVDPRKTSGYVLPLSILVISVLIMFLLALMLNDR